MLSIITALDGPPFFVTAFQQKKEKREGILIEG